MFWRKILRPEQLLRGAPFFSSEEFRSVGHTAWQIHKRPWRTPIRVSKKYFFFTYLLCILNALPAAIFLASWISWRAPWASTRASSALWHALASSASRAETSHSKVSHFFTASRSSCWTSLSLALNFLLAACSLAAFSSASARAFLRASTSVVAHTHITTLRSIDIIYSF